MKGLGLFGLSIPEEYGGLDLTMEEECLVAVELGRTSPAFRSTFGTNVGIGSQGLVMFGTDAQKQKYLPGIASGEIITSFALTEPEAGSDSASVQTRADPRRRPLRPERHQALHHQRQQGRPLHGDGPHRSGEGRRRRRLGLPGGAQPAGPHVGKPEKKMGQQGAHICDVIFDNVRVPVENRLGARGRGLQGGHAGAGPRPAAHLGGLRRRRRAADRRQRGLRHRAQAVRPAAQPASS